MNNVSNLDWQCIIVFAYLQLKCVLTILTEGQRCQRWYNQIHNLGETKKEVHYFKSEKSHLHVVSLTRPHTHTAWVRVKQLEAEDWESALNSSNLHGNVMSALPFDHRKCVPTKGLTPALLKIRIRFYDYYQLQSATWQQTLCTGVLMWMAVGISQTKDFTPSDSKWKEHQRNIL